MKFLQDWKAQPDRKPLVIRGARQVGKSSLARMFGDSYFDNIVEVKAGKTGRLKSLHVFIAEKKT
jgi:uncharacterized protein